MTLLGADGEAELPAEAREVSDVTGAGDTVIATMTLALAAGATLADAAVSPTAPPASSSASSGRRRCRRGTSPAVSQRRQWSSLRFLPQRQRS